MLTQVDRNETVDIMSSGDVCQSGVSVNINSTSKHSEITQLNQSLAHCRCPSLKQHDVATVQNHELVAPPY